MAISEPWIQALRARGARLEGARVIAFAGSGAVESSARETPKLSPVLSDGVLHVEGADAPEFLQGQLTNDVAAVTSAHAQPTAYCTPSGRVLATGLLWNEDTHLLLLTAGDRCEPVRKRLQTHVLRSRVRLTDLSEQRALVGLAGAAASSVMRDRLGFAPSLPYEAITREGTTAISLPGDRVLLILDSDSAPRVWDALAQGCTPSGQGIWDWHAVAAGIPTVTAATQDRFVPQMLNLELVGAVSFRKGCYTGQEIVARTEHLGEVKRRLFRFSSSAPSSPADAVFAGATEVGMVVNCAPAPTAGFELLAVVQLSARHGPLTAGVPEGSPLHPLPLPYAIPGSVTV
ncbi:MAG TPA: hypothetical protein VMH32_07850 [Burkholderiales bacterium]|nr:hypothetical protein [Burkholderiales bacterium]